MIIARRKLSTSLQRSLKTFAARAQKAAALEGEVAILLTDNAEIQQLNRDFRGKNKPTDVLSFPSDAEGLSGDIAISLDIAEDNGSFLGHGTLTELQVLVLHGMLHLAGHDHENDNGEMAAIEQKLREKLGLEHGLIERAQGSGSRQSKTTRTPHASKKGLHGPTGKKLAQGEASNSRSPRVRKERAHVGHQPATRKRT